MERLANDSLPRVRAILAEEIKSAAQCAGAYRQAVGAGRRAHRLRAGARILAAAVGRGFGRNHRLRRASRAACRRSRARSGVSEAVSEAIVASLDVSAVAALAGQSERSDSRGHDRQSDRERGRDRSVAPADGDARRSFVARGASHRGFRLRLAVSRLCPSAAGSMRRRRTISTSACASGWSRRRLSDDTAAAGRKGASLGAGGSRERARSTTSS